MGILAHISDRNYEQAVERGPAIAQLILKDEAARLALPAESARVRVHGPPDLAQRVIDSNIKAFPCRAFRRRLSVRAQ
jgi:hypothetical protein